MTTQRPKAGPQTPAPGDQPAAEPAAGSIEHPIAPGEAHPGDRNEQAAGLGGPVDVFPTRGSGPSGRARSA